MSDQSSFAHAPVSTAPLFPLFKKPLIPYTPMRTALDIALDKYRVRIMRGPAKARRKKR
jgi:hypothetical protein